MQEKPISLRKRLFYTRSVTDASRTRAVLNNAILHLHPTTIPVPALRFTYTWGLGGISTVLAFLLGFTGLLLMFRYDANVGSAYHSIQLLEAQVVFGALIRAVHHWSANLLVVISFLHLVRVFATGGYKRGRTMNWLVGVVLFVIILAFNFTGYLLPWDQLAYWAITVSTSLLSYIPLIGDLLRNFFLGGADVGQSTLRNFYAIHVALLPVLLVGAVSYHFWKIRKNGGISQPERHNGSAAERLTTIPNLVQREFAVGAIVIVVVLLFSMFTPAPLAGIADPVHSPNPAKAAWYFMGLQELLLHMDALAAIGVVGIVLLAMFSIPYLDRRGSDIGIYFRSKKGKIAALVGALLALDLVPLLVIADQFWVDVSTWVPGASPGLTNALIPFSLTILGLLLIYGLIRLFVQANHSESMVGIFIFVIIGLVVLTVIGVYFRGPNMALVLPF